MTHSFPTRRSSDRPGEHREPALGQVDAHVLEVVLACALHADQVVTVRRVSRHGPKLAPRPDTEPQSQPTPCATSSRPKTRNAAAAPYLMRSEEHTSELQSLMRISYAVFCLK